MAGLRVVRGPDWKWDNQDGGEGHVGTVTSTSDKTTGFLNVLWDVGMKNSYRYGTSGISDLRVLDNGPTGARHPGVQCDSCNESSLRGIRWKCADCPDYDLCTECYGNDKHDRQHKFKLRATGDGSWTNVGKRQNATKLQGRGVYRGATVVRGDGWSFGNQDGGDGKVGKVEKIGYKQETGTAISAAVVKWPNGNQSVVCLGWSGRVDVKCKSAAVGWGYYRDHLPAIGDVDALVGPHCKTTNADSDSDSDSETDIGKLLAGLLGASLGESLAGLSAALGQGRRQATLRSFSPGDLVKLHDDPAKVAEFQKGHGGFNVLMIGTCGEVGVVREIDGDGDLKVSFGPINWVLNPAAVTKMSVMGGTSEATGGKFKVGDRIFISKTISETKDMMVGHGGWNNDMAKLIQEKTPGKVIGIAKDGDIRVDFPDRVFFLNPAVCSEYTDRPKKNKNEAKPTSTFTVGQMVTIDKDVDFVKRAQDDHGGWHDSLKQAMKTHGKIVAIDEDGDLDVAFDDQTWTLNPEVCHVYKPKKNKNERVQTAPSTPTTPGASSGAAADSVPVPQGPRFHEGDQVKINVSPARLKTLQSGHGGWSGAMDKCIPEVGVVTRVDGDGDMKVKFRSGTFTLNPEACVSMAPDKNTNMTAKRDESGTSNNMATDNRASGAQFTCQVCQDARISEIFNCGHGACSTCSKRLDNCHICRIKIALKTKMFI